MNVVQRLHPERLAIFLFHGVIETDNHSVRNYTKKHILKKEFSNIIDALKRKGKSISLDAVVDHIKSKQPFPPYSFAITFDDGFDNNYTIAAPILSDKKCPATFFVTTSFIESNEMSWIDKIEYGFETLSHGSIRLPWHPEHRTFRDVREKIRLLEEIRQNVKKDPFIDFDEFVHDVFKQFGIAVVTVSEDPVDKKMGWHQVKALNEDSDFIVGGHSHNHLILSHLKPQELIDEVRTSILLLNDKAGVGPDYYSYPEGLEFCYSDSVISVLKNQGVVCCPTAIDGSNSLDTNLFELKRIAVC